MMFDAIEKHQQNEAQEKIDWEGLIIEESGDVAKSITEIAADLGVDLIVMRSRRRPRAAALLGSTAESVCRTAPCAVFVTHPQEREWKGLSSGVIEVRRVLVGYDFSDDSERSLNYGLSLAQECQAELHLLHVLQRPSDEGPEIAWSSAGLESVYKTAAHRLQQIIPQEVYVWCNVKTAVRWGKPYREILAYAEENEIDLVCMGASGRNFGIGALFGSNVDRVLRQSPCPVLIARPLRPAVKLVQAKR
jgi:nucleotide-binding universal stress UspA family protein